MSMSMCSPKSVLELLCALAPPGLRLRPRKVTSFVRIKHTGLNVIMLFSSLFLLSRKWHLISLQVVFMTKFHLKAGWPGHVFYRHALHGKLVHFLHTLCSVSKASLAFFVFSAYFWIWVRVWFISRFEMGTFSRISSEGSCAGDTRYGVILTSLCVLYFPTFL